MTKAEIRKAYLEKRLALSETDYRALSNRLCQLFFDTQDLASIRFLHLFLPLQKFREPDTRLIELRIRDQFPDICLVAPIVNDTTGEIESHSLFPGELKVSKWGILEPHRSTPVNPKDIDLVIVPLVAFDHHGFRVGYGKGFYDKFLAKCRSDCKRVGLSFFPPLPAITDVKEFDQKLDVGITPKRIYQFATAAN